MGEDENNGNELNFDFSDPNQFEQAMETPIEGEPVVGEPIENESMAQGPTPITEAPQDFEEPTQIVEEQSEFIDDAQPIQYTEEQVMQYGDQVPGANDYQTDFVQEYIPPEDNNEFIEDTNGSFDVPHPLNNNPYTADSLINHDAEEIKKMQEEMDAWEANNMQAPLDGTTSFDVTGGATPIMDTQPVEQAQQPISEGQELDYSGQMIGEQPQDVTPQPVIDNISSMDGSPIINEQVTNKKKKTIKIPVIAILLLAILIIAGVIVALVFTTDMFKSDGELFFKYAGTGLDAMRVDSSVFTTAKGLASKKSSTPFNSTTDITFTGSDGEASGLPAGIDHILDATKISIKEEADLSSNIFNIKTELKTGEQRIAGFSIARGPFTEEELDTIGIMMEDVDAGGTTGFDKYYLSATMDELNDTLEPFGLTGIDFEELLNSNKANYYDLFAIDDVVYNNIKETYPKAILSAIEKGRFSKENNITTHVGLNDYITTKYSLKLSATERATLYKTVLNTLKTDNQTLNMLTQKAKILGIKNLSEIKGITSYIDTLIKDIDKNIKTGITFEEYVYDKEVIQFSIVQDSGEVITIQPQNKDGVKTISLTISSIEVPAFEKVETVPARDTTHNAPNNETANAVTNETVNEIVDEEDEDEEFDELLAEDLLAEYEDEDEDDVDVSTGMSTKKIKDVTITFTIDAKESATKLGLKVKLGELGNVNIQYKVNGKVSDTKYSESMTAEIAIDTLSTVLDLTTNTTFVNSVENVLNENNCYLLSNFGEQYKTAVVPFISQWIEYLYNVDIQKMSEIANSNTTNLPTNRGNTTEEPVETNEEESEEDTNTVTNSVANSTTNTTTNTTSGENTTSGGLRRRTTTNET